MRSNMPTPTVEETLTNTRYFENVALSLQEVGLVMKCASEIVNAPKKAETVTTPKKTETFTTPKKTETITTAKRDVLNSAAASPPLNKRKRKTSKAKKCCFAKEAFHTLNELRKNGKLCDFTITTGDKNHHVHRIVLTARSAYFRDIFTLKPTQRELPFTKSFDEGVQCCVEFMYTNDILVNLKNVEEVFDVSLAFRLDDVSKICHNFLMEDLTVESCLIIKRIAERFRDDLLNFGVTNLENKAEKFAINHLPAVIKTKPFLTTPAKDLIRLLSFEPPASVIIDSISVWVAYDLDTRRHDVGNILKSVNFSKFSCNDFVLATNAAELIASPGVPELLAVEISKRTNSELSFENWSGLRDLAIKFKIPDLEVKIDQFVFRNFSMITKTSNFLKIDKFLLMRFIKVILTTNLREEVVWDAIIGWTKFHEERKECLAEIIRFIPLSRFSLDFIKNTVKNEKLVIQDNECLKMIIDCLCTRMP